MRIVLSSHLSLYNHDFPTGRPPFFPPPVSTIYTFCTAVTELLHVCSNLEQDK